MMTSNCWCCLIQCDLLALSWFDLIWFADRPSIDRSMTRNGERKREISLLRTNNDHKWSSFVTIAIPSLFYHRDCTYKTITIALVMTTTVAHFTAVLPVRWRVLSAIKMHTLLLNCAVAGTWLIKLLNLINSKRTHNRAKSTLPDST